MKTLKDFTSDVQKKIPLYVKVALDGVFDGGRYNAFDIEKARAAVRWNYLQCGYEEPFLIVAENPYEAQIIMAFLKETTQLDSQLGSQLGSQLRSQLDSQLDSQLGSQLGSQLRSQLGSQLDSQLDSQLGWQLRSQLGIKRHNDYLFTLNVYSDCIWAWYRFINDELSVPLKSEIKKAATDCFALQRASGVYSAIFTKAVCIVSKYPKRVYRDNLFRLHNTEGVAVEWGKSTDFTGFECYYIHGRMADKVLFTENITEKQFMAEQDEEKRAMMYEILESRGDFTKMIGAEVVDECTLAHGDGSLETIKLYKTSSKFDGTIDAITGERNVQLAWLQLKCPSTGQYFMIPSFPSFKTALEAAKHHRPENVPLNTEYSWVSRN